jgi:hypothetical protein
VSSILLSYSKVTLLGLVLAARALIVDLSLVTTNILRSSYNRVNTSLKSIGS